MFLTLSLSEAIRNDQLADFIAQEVEKRRAVEECRAAAEIERLRADLADVIEALKPFALDHCRVRTEYDFCRARAVLEKLGVI